MAQNLLRFIILTPHYFFLSYVITSPVLSQIFKMERINNGKVIGINFIRFYTETLR